MKYVPITQEIFKKLVGSRNLVCEYIPHDLGMVGIDKSESYDYFLHPYTKIPFVVLGCLSKYIFPKGCSDPLTDLIKTGEKIESDLSYWILERVGDLDNTFMKNSYCCFGVRSPKDYETLPKYNSGIYELTLPIADAFTKTIWVNLEKYYDWSQWEVGIAYKNMFDCFPGTYYNMNLKQHYLNIVGAKLYELNSEKGC